MTDSTEPTLHLTRTEFMRRFCGVDDLCHVCQGLGRRMYNNSSTWHYGAGANTITWDVCDDCWGTGDMHRTGVNLRKQRDEMRDEIARKALTYLSDAACASVRGGEEVEEICKELDKLARGRKPRPRFFHSTCEALARTLRRAVAASKEGSSK